MAATVLFGGDDVISHMSYGSLSNRAVDYFNEVNQHSSRYLTDMGRRFMERSSSLFQRKSGAEIGRIARSIKEQVTHYWQEDSIRTLQTIEDVQNAPDKMVRWIMANPTIREHYRKGVLDGYSDRYIDHESDVPARERTDYKLIMSGLQIDDHVIEYFNEIMEEEVRPHFDERLRIRHAWEIGDVGLEARRDVTSKWDVSF